MDKRALVSLIRQQTKGRGGMADNIPGMIKETGQPIRVSHGEFIVPADVVSMIGDGSSEEGARILTQMMQEVRKNKGKQLVKGKQAKPMFKGGSVQKFAKGGKVEDTSFDETQGQIASFIDDALMGNGDELLSTLSSNPLSTIDAAFHGRDGELAKDYYSFKDKVGQQKSLFKNKNPMTATMQTLGMMGLGGTTGLVLGKQAVKNLLEKNSFARVFNEINPGVLTKILPVTSAAKGFYEPFKNSAEIKKRKTYKDTREKK